MAFDLSPNQRYFLFLSYLNYSISIEFVKPTTKKTASLRKRPNMTPPTGRIQNLRLDKNKGRIERISPLDGLKLAPGRGRRLYLNK